MKLPPYHDDDHLPGPSGKERFPRLAGILSDLTTTSRYTALTPAEQRAIDEFLEGNRQEDYREDLFERNHQAYDIGLRLIVAHTPPPCAPVTQLDTALELSSQDQLMVQRCLALYDAICNHDSDKRHDILTQLPYEQQSLTIQTCKQCITNLFTHPSGRSALLPYMTANRLYFYAPQIIPPVSDLIQVFHDIVVTRSLGDHATKELLRDPSHHQLKLFYTDVGSAKTYPLPSERPPQEDTPPPKYDPYLHEAFVQTTDISTTIKQIIERYAFLHTQYRKKDTYTNEGVAILEEIRTGLIHIQELQGHIHLHYFVRHLPTPSDENGHSSTPTEDITTARKKVNIAPRLCREKEMLVCTSSRKYAKKSAKELIKQYQEETNHILQYTQVSGLDNYKKNIFFRPINKLNNENELILLIDYLQFIGVSSINITHSRVLKRLLKTYDIPVDHHQFFEEDHAALVMPIIGGNISPEKHAPHPEAYIRLAEQVRVLMHTHAQQDNISLDQFTTSWNNNLQIYALSMNTFRYRVVDVLRAIEHTNHIHYQDLFTELITIIKNDHPAIKQFLLTKHHHIVQDSTVHICI